MRESRIPHPRGGRFVQIHVWAVQAVGHACAAVLGELDYLDRAQDQPAKPLASRARIIAELEGIVGKNAVDSALHDLADLGWVVRHAITSAGLNITTTHFYSLRAEAIALYMSERGIAGVLKSGHRVSLNRGRNGDAFNNKEKECSAAAAAGRDKDKVRSERPSGIVTWKADDVLEAGRLEAATPGEEISAAVAVIEARGKDPVPGLVAREVKTARARAAARARGEQSARMVRAENLRTEIKNLEMLAAAAPNENAAGALRDQAARLRAQLLEFRAAS